MTGVFLFDEDDDYMLLLWGRILVNSREDLMAG